MSRTTALILSCLLLNIVHAGTLSQVRGAFRNDKRQDQIPDPQVEEPRPQDVQERTEPSTERVPLPPTKQLLINDPAYFKAVAPEVRDRLALYAQYAAASYCNYNNEHTEGGLPIDCHGLERKKLRRQTPDQTDVCPLVEQKKTKTIFEFRNVGWTDSTGFVAVNEEDKTIILSYRGSHDLKNFLADADFPHTWVRRFCNLCWVHDGFYRSFELTEDAVVGAVMKARETYPGYGVVVVGHSLGGALANLAAYVLRQKQVTLDLYTYGAPRVGDGFFAWYSADQGYGKNYRVSHIHDPVPGLPPWWLDYRHIWPQYFITSGNGVEVKPEDIVYDESWYSKTYDGSVESEGPEVILAPAGFDEAVKGQDPLTSLTLPSIKAHLWYFRSMTGCDKTTQQYPCENGDTDPGCKAP